MKIAIIGSGIAGNTIAYRLHQCHDITVFEANNYIGGHAHTHSIELLGKTHQVDTGFIVFNDRTYPNFIQLLDEVGVQWQASDMSFSVRDEVSGLEYNGTTINSLFAQRSNLFKPSFYRMIKDILRFNRESPALLMASDEIKFGDYLQENDYSKPFINHYIVPMGAAIWSTDAARMLDFPAKFFIRFFHHHGMLSINDRPQWLTITKGSANYVKKLTKGFKSSIKLNTPIQKVRRLGNKVIVKPVDSEGLIFDYIFFTCHSDQALAILGQDATKQEHEVLGAIPYQENTVYLHHDATLMPKRRRAWAAWNYHITDTASNKVRVTYNMNILQAIQSIEPLLVTLNHTKVIDPSKVIKRLMYSHPLYTIAGTKAQARHAEISGRHRTAYAGAYWGNGFHEDGVVSALAALKHFEASGYAG